MSVVYLLKEAERKEFFTEAVIRSGIPFPIIEKDFWVVFTLDCMFSIPEIHEHLTFKGGTSLSKVYGIIDRFSEDVDLSIEKDFFGFGKDHAPESESSRKKQKISLEKLSQTSAEYIQNTLIDRLATINTGKLGTSKNWNLMVDPNDSQTLQFEYPSITSPGGYIRPSVKIELGARSEHWPVARYSVQSYLKQYLLESITEPPVAVKVLPDTITTFTVF